MRTYNYANTRADILMAGYFGGRSTAEFFSRRVEKLYHYGVIRAVITVETFS